MLRLAKRIACSGQSEFLKPAKDGAWRFRHLYNASRQASPNRFCLSDGECRLSVCFFM